jgi:hypothetical protein
MHGSFSPVDVRNTLIAVGPDFRGGYADDYPTSNLDVAPTLAALLHVSLPHAEGRVLDEALRGPEASYRVETFAEKVGPVPLRRSCNLDDPDCKRPARGHTYAFSLHGQTLTSTDGSRRYVYLDKAKATRSP